jgi:hypothetical protein
VLSALLYGAVQMEILRIVRALEPCSRSWNRTRDGLGPQDVQGHLLWRRLGKGKRSGRRTVAHPHTSKPLTFLLIGIDAAAPKLKLNGNQMQTHGAGPGVT